MCVVSILLQDWESLRDQTVISMQLFQEWMHVCTNEYDKYMDMNLINNKCTDKLKLIYYYNQQPSRDICISYIIWQYMLAFYPANVNSSVFDKILSNTRVLEKKWDMTTSLWNKHDTCCWCAHQWEFVYYT